MVEVDADDDANIETDVRVGVGPEGKSNGDSAVGPREGISEYGGSSALLQSWPSIAALLTSASFCDIVSVTGEEV